LKNTEYFFDGGKPMKISDVKAISLILSTIIIASVGTPSSIKKEPAPKITANAVIQSYDSSVDTVEVMDYKIVKGIPDSEALDILEDTPCSTFEEVGEQAGEKQDSNPLTSVISFLQIYSNGINNLDIYLCSLDENIYEFYCEYDDDNGEHHIFASGIYYDKTTQLIYGKDNNGCFALGFDFDTEQMAFYTSTDAWQRDFGYCKLYDILAPALNFNYETVRVYFTYDSYDWLIQIWKGFYVITNGAEMGLYNKPVGRPIDFYDCATDSQMMPMALRLYNKDNGELIYDMEMKNNWWVSGFSLKDMFTKDNLYLEGDLKFPNEDMFNAFMSSFEPVALDNGIEYVTNGLIVSFDW